MKYLIILCVITLTLIPKVALTIPNLTQAKVMDERAFKLGRFFEKRKCPQVNFELIDDYINAADKYNIPYNLLPAISVAESSCAKRYPKATSNIFGWNSARYTFASIPESIDFISERLSTGKYYANKSIVKKLAAYCPTATYPERVISIMKDIDN